MSTDPLREQTFERSLPHSAEAERACLGGIILDNLLISQAASILKPEDFYVPSHRRIFVAMVGLFEHGSEINPILIGEELKKENALETVGGISFITNLTYGLPHSTNILHYAKVVRGKSMLRRLIKTASKITNIALEEEDQPEIILEQAQQAIFELGDEKLERRTLGAKEMMVTTRLRLESFRKGSTESTAAIPTPWPNLNNLCRGGIQETELWGIAALMKQGKSALMKQWAQYLAMAGRRVLIFTREMSEIKIIFRMLAALTEIPASQIRYGLDDNRIDQLIASTRQLEDKGIFINSKTSDVDEFHSVVREMIRLEGVELVFGDYLQLFRGKGKKNDSRATEVGYVWRTMKDTAQDLNTRICALAQFNREAFKASDRPFFHQVEGSGEGEKAVDVGMVLWTELSKGEPGARPAKLFIDYQRDEDAGTHADLIFNGRTMEFYQVDQGRTAREEREMDFND